MSTAQIDNYVKGLANHLSSMFPEGTRHKVAKATADYVLARDGFGRFVSAYSERNQSDQDKRYIAAADQRAREGELEIDDNAVVSSGCDDGAYVMAWVWVSDDDLDA